MKRIVALMILGTILLGLAAPTLAGPPQQGGSVSGSFGDPGDIYLEFSISGADFVLMEGTRADYVGTWNGGPIHFSGKMTVTRPEGYKSFVTMRASDVAQFVRWPEEGQDGAVSGTSVSLPFDFTYTPPPDETGTVVSVGSARVEACGGVCDAYSVSYEAVAPTPEPTQEAPPPTEEPLPSPTTQRHVTIRGTISAVDVSAAGSGGQVKPIMEAPVLLFRGGEEWTRMLSQPPDGAYEFIVPHTPDLSVGVFLEHGLSSPSAFQVVYDQSADPIWVATEPFDVDEYSPDILVKDINLSDPGALYSGPTPVPPDRLDDVGLTYYYAREAWQMAAILLGLEFDLPTVKIRPFSTHPDVAGTAFWTGPNTGQPYYDPVIDISPKYSDYGKAGAGDTVMHEFGHHVMADAYDNDMPYVTGETPHGGFANNTTTDSWIEGFATFYALWTKRDQIQSSMPQVWWSQGDAENLEPNALAWDWPEEYAVSGLLWDLLDPIEPGDATGMPVVANPAGVVAVTVDQTLYGDNVQVDSASLWDYLTNGALASFDSPPAAPQGYPHIFDVKQLYETLQANGVGLTVAATANGLDAVDELFIAHGFFADVAPQNQAWDLGEEIGVTGNLSMTVGQETYPERLNRRSPPPKKSYITYQVVDAAGGGAVGVTDFVVEVRFESPFELYDYEVPVRGWSEDTLYYSAPPPHYAWTATFRASGPGVVSSSALTLTSQEYWDLRASNPTGSLMDHTFEVEWNADAAAASSTTGGDDTVGGFDIEDLQGEFDPDDASTWVGPAILALGCCGVPLVLLMSVGLFVGSRRRKRRQAAAVQQPGQGMQSSAPVRPAPAPVRQPPAAGGWQLAVVQGPLTGQRFALGQQARIGRSRDNEISLEDGQASRHHAQVWQTPDGYAVQDTGSTNGTFVNGTRIQQPVRLSPGDRLQVGDTVMQVTGPSGGGACPQCGQAAQPGTRFCGQCGATLA